MARFTGGTALWSCAAFSSGKKRAKTTISRLQAVRFRSRSCLPCARGGAAHSAAEGLTVRAKMPLQSPFGVYAATPPALLAQTHLPLHRGGERCAVYGRRKLSPAPGSPVQPDRRDLRAQEMVIFLPGSSFRGSPVQSGRRDKAISLPGIRPWLPCARGAVSR